VGSTATQSWQLRVDLGGMAAQGAAKGMCVRAEEVIKKYSQGRQLIPIERLGVSPLNRPVSWKHVHYLMRRIVEKEGFAETRYQRAIAVEPDDSDPTGTWKHTKQLAEDSCGKLAHPSSADQKLFSVISKNHLICGLQCLKFGGIRWDDTNEVMTPPPPSDGNEQLHKALQKGVWVEVLSSAAIKEDPEGVKALIDSENLDQAHSLPEHEIELLQRLWNESTSVRGMAPLSQWCHVNDSIQKRSAGTWCEDDLMNVLKYARTKSKAHINAVGTFHFHYVNATVVRVKTSFMKELAEHLPDEFPWCATAMLCAQYMSSPKDMVNSGRGYIAEGIKGSALKQLALREHTSTMTTAERFLSSMLTQLFTGRMEAQVRKACATLMSKVGTFLSKSAFFDKTEEKLTNIEVKFYEETAGTSVQLVEPHFKSTRSQIEENKQKEQPRKVPEMKPWMIYDENGNVVKDMTFRASQKGMFVGVDVECLKSGGSGRSKVNVGAKGVVKGFTEKAVIVEWESGAQTNLSMTSLKVHNQGEGSADDPKEEDGEEVEEENAAITDTVNWFHSDDAMSEWFLQNCLQNALYHYNVSIGARCESIVVERDTKRMFYADDLSQRSVHLIPYTDNIVKDGDTPPSQHERDYVMAYVTVGDSTEMPFRLYKPTDTFKEDGRGLLFWLAMDQEGPNVKSNLSKFEITVKMNAAWNAQELRCVTPARKNIVIVRFPVLSNPDNVNKWTRAVVEDVSLKRKVGVAFPGKEDEGISRRRMTQKCKDYRSKQLPEDVEPEAAGEDGAGKVEDRKEDEEAAEEAANVLDEAEQLNIGEQVEKSVATG